MNVVQDGVPGSGPPDSLEMVTQSTGLDGGCARDYSFCATVLLRSFYADRVLRSTYVELTDMTPPSGNTAYGGSPGAYGLSATYGLWSYGNLAPNGTATRSWKFDNYSGTNFRLNGRVLAAIEDVGASSESSCANAADDDGDELVDCADPDCSINRRSSLPVPRGRVNSRRSTTRMPRVARWS